MSKKSDCNK